SFNVPYLPMVEPVVRAVVDTDSFAFIATARLEWYKYEAKGLRPVLDAFMEWNRPEYVALHLDHVPVIDEDDVRVDYLDVLKEALDMGYRSVMIDGSRLPFEENIAASRQAVELAHGYGIACEAELGAVMGHEAGPMPPYDEIFASGKGFTDVKEARRFAAETGCDWLSVAIGNVHGAVSTATRDQKKVEARLNIEHLRTLRDATGLPLVLHGGSGVQRAYVLEAIKNGIAKVNVCTEIRQPYEVALRETNDIAKAQQACYERTCWVIADYFGIAGMRAKVAV
ncbi:MAG: class II fructose-bisphosphate aldolase, partial [Candidatus Hydrogenedentes bacterium]|nr:class II fructose-bisphosphate aldolase [Candidatus Hydrogenedentota bacterium]